MGLKFKKKKDTLKKRAVITHENPKSPIAEQYRTLRTNLQFASVDKELESLLITSPGPFEGKSLTAANVAAVFAQQGKKVLLVDADLRKPTIHYTFQVANTTGLSSYLVNDLSLTNVVQNSGIDNLYLLSSGPVPPNPSELLSSKQMKKMMTEANQHFDLIIFDTPPVLAVTDTQILSNDVDGVLLVIRSKQTESEAAKKARDLLKQSHANILGAVLNDQSTKDSNYYYYYGNK
ncbi:CpsD/CapB family tyrosine-protein kinase [Alteribacillus bidgolensis]|uniref:non-specific protein-tyrosine kinase n=1 Tax=Alteribacillus bidgolensis TaxID=930129 RepID=A0A1G8PPU0_9BACI|nr:CpsD/CapB family tyrosine-protein kinase [Alteribacillus bidgolensis]SDI94453.1 capsular exopolysaccharide family [Alteribacillus bidgolensis]